VNFEDFGASLEVGQTELDLTVQTARAQQSGVQSVGTEGRTRTHARTHARTHTRTKREAERAREVGGRSREVPVSGHQHFDVAASIEAVEFCHNLKHSTLHLIVAARAVIETSAYTQCTDSGRGTNVRASGRGWEPESGGGRQRAGVGG
jgi:hypothetical protein